jgi:hypothetical protein
MAPPDMRPRPALKGHDLDELSMEQIQHYVMSLSQYHKIFLHRTLAHWRNLTGVYPHASPRPNRTHAAAPRTLFLIDFF